jgi:hypothetical protein
MLKLFFTCAIYEMFFGCLLVVVRCWEVLLEFKSKKPFSKLGLIKRFNFPASN